MDKELRVRQQAEWLATFKLNQEQYKKLLLQKLERNAQLQCKKPQRESCLV
jgi:hypothetical protein